MSNELAYVRYTFQARSGYIIHPARSDTAHPLVAIGHTASVAPWTDPGIHLHPESEEYYLLLHGELRFLVGGSLLSLKSNEILMLKPQVPHAIIGGEGIIEHFGIRAPAPDDKVSAGQLPQKLPPLSEEQQRELRCDWGNRIPLAVTRNQNCWLIGTGVAKFQSDHLIFAFLNHDTTEAANAGIGTRHRLHYHQRSWEYYGVLRGKKTVQIDEELVEIRAGEILEVPPHVCHTLHSRQAPYRGFTLRVPVALDDKVDCVVPKE